MKEIKNENKKSKLVFDPKIARKLLKMNDKIMYCPYCGKSIEEKCGCTKNIIVDVKPYRDTNGNVNLDKTVFVFDNNPTFQNDYNQLIEEDIVKKAEHKTEAEQN